VHKLEAKRGAEAMRRNRRKQCDCIVREIKHSRPNGNGRNTSRKNSMRAKTSVMTIYTKEPF